MSTLKEKADEILAEKEAKIIPENIKAGVQIFDIEGVYSADIPDYIEFEEDGFTQNLSYLMQEAYVDDALGLTFKIVEAYATTVDGLLRFRMRVTNTTDDAISGVGGTVFFDNGTSIPFYAGSVSANSYVETNFEADYVSRSMLMGHSYTVELL